MPTDVLTTDLRPIPCPACGYQLEQATGTTPPAPGGVTLCAHCFVFLIFDGPALDVRRLLDREWLALPADRRQFFAGVRDRLRQRLRRPPSTT
jgi:hypothetical protein